MECIFLLVQLKEKSCNKTNKKVKKIEVNRKIQESLFEKRPCLFVISEMSPKISFHIKAHSSLKSVSIHLRKSKNSLFLLKGHMSLYKINIDRTATSVQPGWTHFPFFFHERETSMSLIKHIRRLRHILRSVDLIPEKGHPAGFTQRYCIFDLTTGHYVTTKRKGGHCYFIKKL